MHRAHHHAHIGEREAEEQQEAADDQPKEQAEPLHGISAPAGSLAPLRRPSQCFSTRGIFAEETLIGTNAWRRFAVYLVTIIIPKSQCPRNRQSTKDGGSVPRASASLWRRVPFYTFKGQKWQHYECGAIKGAPCFAVLSAGQTPLRRTWPI